MFGFGEPFIG